MYFSKSILKDFSSVTRVDFVENCPLEGNQQILVKTIFVWDIVDGSLPLVSNQSFWCTLTKYELFSFYLKSIIYLIESWNHDSVKAFNELLGLKIL